jgi:hypothetical protein
VLFKVDVNKALIWNLWKRENILSKSGIEIEDESSNIKINYLKMPCPSRDGRISDSKIFEL